MSGGPQWTRRDKMWKGPAYDGENWGAGRTWFSGADGPAICRHCRWMLFYQCRGESNWSRRGFTHHLSSDEDARRTISHLPFRSIVGWKHVLERGEVVVRRLSMFPTNGKERGRLKTLLGVWKILGVTERDLLDLFGCLVSLQIPHCHPTGT